MGSLMSAIRDDIQEYVSLCNLYGHEVRYRKDAYGNSTEDCYGSHSEQLHKRKEQETIDRMGKSLKYEPTVIVKLELKKVSRYDIALEG
jgi:hypothetical protein